MASKARGFTILTMLEINLKLKRSAQQWLYLQVAWQHGAFDFLRLYALSK
jgi:hypothetical protein